MKPANVATLVMGTTLMFGWGLGHAQEKADIGKLEYDNSCAVCHGPQGKGDGPMAGIIETPVPDLSKLAERNGGVFPLARVYETIDGSAAIGAHGTRDMPVWGYRYSVDVAEYYTDYYREIDDEALVRARILAVAEYLHRLQE